MLFHMEGGLGVPTVTRDDPTLFLHTSNKYVNILATASQVYLYVFVKSLC